MIMNGVNMVNTRTLTRIITSRQFSNCIVIPYAHKRKSLDRALSLEEFMFRAKVKSTYRNLVRIIYKSHEREELLRYAKHEFELNEKMSDLSQRRYLLNDGVNKINQALAMMNLQGSVSK